MIVPLAEIERAAIEDAVSITGCAAHAADALGVGRMTVYRRLAVYAKLSPREDRAEEQHAPTFRELYAALAVVTADRDRWRARCLQPSRS